MAEIFILYEYFYCIVKPKNFYLELYLNSLFCTYANRNFPAKHKKAKSIVKILSNTN